MVTRIPFVEKYQSHWDGPQYSIALIHYSFEQQTPAPPGYPLYIALGKLFYQFIPDPHSAMLAVSVVGNAIGVITIFLVGTYLGNMFVGIIASSIFLSGSTFYYFGLTPYPYGLLPFAYALVGFAVYESYIKQESSGLLLGLAVSIGLGIRPQEILLIGPLCLLGFLALPLREKMKMLSLCSIVFLMWFIPLVYAVGGFSAFLQTSGQFSKGALHPSILRRMINAQIMLKGFLLSFGISTFAFLYYIQFIKDPWFKDKEKLRIVVFYVFWIVPGFMFNLLIRSDHAGYQMGYLTGFLFIIGYGIWQLTKKNTFTSFIILVCIIIFNLVWFFYDRDPKFVKPYRPTSFHYSDIRKNDLKVGSKVQFIESHFSPKTTLIITTDVLWRPYMYYFKDYHLTNLSGLDIRDAGYAYNRYDAFDWLMHEYENESLIVSIPTNTTSVVFPDDDAYKWIKKQPITIFHLPGNSIIAEIKVLPNQMLHYKYHEVTINE